MISLVRMLYNKSTLLSIHNIYYCSIFKADRHTISLYKNCTLLPGFWRQQVAEALKTNSTQPGQPLTSFDTCVLAASQVSLQRCPCSHFLNRFCFLWVILTMLGRSLVVFHFCGKVVLSVPGWSMMHSTFITLDQFRSASSSLQCQTGWGTYFHNASTFLCQYSSQNLSQHWHQHPPSF